eukprot:TRINITY_DN124229_c0_g1_i1.p1 TRINITY_DN124229_c0_g1~~TRINITY_DN124229_c0_g1_i1.p1  ORF type:complete len:379 (-),score=50.83 TRINITY_DN124229_c0_g1_i1:146-1282(-)
MLATSSSSSASASQKFTHLPPEIQSLIGQERWRQLSQQWTESMEPVQCAKCMLTLPKQYFSHLQLKKSKKKVLCNRCLGSTPPNIMNGADVTRWQASAMGAFLGMNFSWLTCSQCMNTMPRMYFSPAAMRMGQHCCMTCMANSASALAWAQAYNNYYANAGYSDSSSAAAHSSEQSEGRVVASDGLPEEPSEILVVNSETSGAHTALTHEAQLSDLVAIDAEWRPDFARGSDNPVAVMQLAFPSSRRVYVIQLRRLKNGLPSAVRSMLLNPSVTKVGFAMAAKDSEKYMRSGIAITSASVFDMQEPCARYLGCTDKTQLGLKRAAEELLGFYKMDKDKRISCSEWDREDLTSEQIRYAALDAWVALRLYYHATAVFLG